MQIDVTSHAKYRASGREGDDVPLVLPGIAFGVFDGATDARGTMIDGVGAGRFAALTVAGAAAALFADPQARDLPGNEIVAHLSTRLAARTAPLGLPIPPSTTLALAIDRGDDWRFFTLGDSGIRINGTEVLCRHKIIDAVSTHARVALFRHFAGTTDDLDAVEQSARRAIFLGLDAAVAEGAVPEALAAHIMTDAARSTGLAADEAVVRTFLSGGISTQHGFANRDDNALCFDSMNGDLPRLGEIIDEVRPKAEVRSIEIFSDGYVSVPADATAAAWEAAFAAAEAEDFHKIGRFATVKGSTSTEVFDDRTVVVLSALTTG